VVVVLQAVTAVLAVLVAVAMALLVVMQQVEL
jgi:hypothetical protein